jgi:PAS domain S-box-containing protein
MLLPELNQKSDDAMKVFRHSRLDVVVSVTYVVIATIWILVSDLLLFNDIPSASASLLKGLAFVAVTGGTLYLVLRHGLKRRAELEAELRAQQQAVQERADIAERYEQRMRALFHNNPQPMWFYDEATLAFLDVNDAAIAQYGYTRAEFLKMNLMDIRPPEERQRLKEHLAQERPVLQASGEWRHQRKNGEIFWVEIYSHLMTYEGRPAVLVIAIDITRRRQVELQLKQQAHLIDNLADAVVATDNQFVITTWNRAAESMYGWKASEVIGRPFNEVIATQYEDDTPSTVLRSFIHTGLWKDEVVQTRRDGTRLNVLAAVAAIYDEQGQIVGAVGVNRDITERKMADERMRQTEHRFAAVFRNQHIGITISRMADGLFVDVNDAFLRIIGYEREQIVGRRIADLGIWNEIERRPELVQRLQDHGRYHDEELTFVRGDGSHGVALVSAEVVEMMGERCILGMVSDITARKQAETDQRLRAAAMEAAANGIMITNRAGRIEWVNPAFTQLTGYTLEESVGRTPGQLLHSGYQDAAYYREMHEAMDRGEVWRSQLVNRRKDRTLYTEEQTITPVYDSAGQITHYVAIKQDITHRKQAEAEIMRLNADLERRIAERTSELAIARDRLEAIINNSSEVIVLCRVDGTMEQLNPAVLATFGYREHELLYQPLELLGTPADAPALKAAFGRVLETWEAQRVEITAQRRDRQSFVADVMLSPVIEHRERLLSVVVSIRDITSHRQIEDRLRQVAERAMELSELKSRYVSMAAHDLRNPLAVIQSALSLLIEYSDRLTEEKCRSKYEQIRTSVRTMVQMLDDILTLAQSESGKLVFDPSMVDVRQLCQDIVEDSVVITGMTRRINFTMQRECGTLYVDGTLIRHIVGNLISNALKYSPVSSAVDFEVVCSPRELTMTVRDYGIGIPPEDQPHLFESFYRASNARKVPGTGLGLSIVKQFVELHKGRISFVSEPEQGTTFTVVLPVGTPPA